MFDGLNLILVEDPMQTPLVGAAPMLAGPPGIAGHNVEGLWAWLGLTPALNSRTSCAR